MIKQISDLEIGIYQDAVRHFSGDASKGYCDLNGFLAEQTASGDISEDLIAPNHEEQIKRFGKAVPPVIQLMAKAGIRVNNNMAQSASVFLDDKGDKSYVKGASVLFPAFSQMAFEKGLGLNAGGFFTSGASAAGDTVFPQVIRPGITDQRLPDDPNMVRLSELVSMTTTINSDSYKSATIQEQTDADFELTRVAEGAELPKYVIATSEREIRVYKYGGQIQATYEFLRRASINLVALTFEQIGMSEQLRLIKQALTTLLNGDGNASSAANNTAITGLGGTSGSYDELSLKKWMLTTAYTYGVQPIVFVGDLTEGLEILEMAFPSANLALTPDQLRQLNLGDLSVLGRYTYRNAPAGSVLDSSEKLLGFNPGRALEMVMENGSTISESTRWVTNQTQAYTFSNNYGFSKPQRQHAHTLERTA